MQCKSFEFVGEFLIANITELYQMHNTIVSFSINLHQKTCESKDKSKNTSKNVDDFLTLILSKVKSNASISSKIIHFLPVAPTFSRIVSYVSRVFSTATTTELLQFSKKVLFGFLKKMLMMTSGKFLTFFFQVSFKRLKILRLWSNPSTRRENFYF